MWTSVSGVRLPFRDSSDSVVDGPVGGLDFNDYAESNGTGREKDQAAIKYYLEYYSQLVTSGHKPT